MTDVCFFSGLGVGDVHAPELRQVRHYRRHGAGGGGAGGSAPGRHPLPGLLRQEDDGGQQPGEAPGRLRDNGQRHHNLLRQDGDSDNEQVKLRYPQLFWSCVVED